MNIGYFFDDYKAAKQYADDLFGIMSPMDESVVLKERSLTIQSFGNKIHFIVINDFRDVYKISGMTFDGVFLKSAFTAEIDRYILSRFRKRCDCKV